MIFAAVNVTNQGVQAPSGQTIGAGARAMDQGAHKTMNNRPNRCPQCGAFTQGGDAACAECGANLIPRVAPRSPLDEAGDGAASSQPGGETAGPTMRRRIGGTTYQAEPAIARAADPAGSPAAPIPGTAPAAIVASGRKRKRHRRRWFRRPLIVTPLLLLLIAAGGVGFGLFRAGSTIATVHALSTPPPFVVVNPETQSARAAQPAGSSTTAPSATAVAGGATAHGASATLANLTNPSDQTAASGASYTNASPTNAAPTQSPPAESTPKTIQIDTAPAIAAVAADAKTRPAEHQTSGGLFGGIRAASANVKDMADGAAVAAGIKDAPAGALNILVMGVDARPGQPIDIAVRPDALMVVHLDPAANSCRLLAVPRDTRTNLPGYGLTKVNHALMVGGIPYERLVVEHLLGIAIDRYALIDFTGYQQLVDAVGGVTITVPDSFTGVGGIQFSPGTQILTGEQALAYARYRYDPNGDFGRVRRQQQIIQGLAQAVSGRDVIGDVNNLLPPLSDHVRTDLSPAEMIALAKQYRTTCAGDAITMDSLQGSVQLLEDPMFQIPLSYNIVDDAEIRRKVATLLGK